MPLLLLRTMGSQKPLAIAAIAIFLVIVAEVAANTECNGHGHTNGTAGHCTCDDATPRVGQLGHAGEECDIRVFGGAADGADVTAVCAHEHGCNTLHPKDWVCFYIDTSAAAAGAAGGNGGVDGSGANWKYLALMLNRTGSAGDPDLYGMWHYEDDNTSGGGGGAGAEGGAGGAPPPPPPPPPSPSSPRRQPRKAMTAYDFAETSSSLHPFSLRTVPRARPDGGDPSAIVGAWVCVHAYGKADVQFSLRAATTLCPGSFDAGDGTPLVCSSRLAAPESERRHDGCSAEGVCRCRRPWASPVEAPYAGLGFESCAAEVVEVMDAKFTAEGGSTFEDLHEVIDPGLWRYYAFNVSESDYQTVVSVLEEDSGQRGMVDVFIQYGEPPGFHFDQWAFSQQLAYDTYYDAAALDEIVWDRNDPKWRTGTWFVGVFGDRRQQVAYTISISRYRCPLACSGHGTCRADATCDCEDGFGGPSCAVERKQLRFGESVTRPPAPFEYDTFTLESLPAKLASRSIEATVEVSFSSPDGDFGGWLLTRPELLLLQGGEDDVPTVRNYTLRRTLDSANTTYGVSLSSKQLANGHWHVAVYNPGRLFSIAYNLTVRREARCLNDCSGHGSCSKEGECCCENGWLGGDCSVAASHTSSGSGGGKSGSGGSGSGSGSGGGKGEQPQQQQQQQQQCQEGTRRPRHMPDAHGTCWHECLCDDHSSRCEFYDGACAAFTCSEDPGEPPLRRVPGQEKCVRDECGGDRVEAVVAGGGSACVRRCRCPDDGGACTFDSECEPSPLVCADTSSAAAGGGGGGAKLAGRNASSAAATCEAGSLAPARVALPDSVAAAYAPCACSGSGGGGGGSGGAKGDCAYASADVPARSLLLVCKDGFVLQGAGASADSPGLPLGGDCVRAAESDGAGGAPAWAVAVAVVSSLMAGAAVGVAALWLWEFRLRPSVGGQDVSIYQELSMHSVGF